MKGPVCILASSHMDREWYLPMDEYRVFFCRVLDRAFELLEKKKDFRFFVDGQTSVVLDYLEARPERSEDFKRYIKEGRMKIGPWHVQSDERMPAGESHIRNLLMGRREAEALGGWMRLGYMPDDFGHISQTPQILKGFGMSRAFMMRGPRPEETGREFIWRGADGSEVFCVCAEYGNASMMHPEDGLKDGIRLIKNRAELEEMLSQSEKREFGVSDFALFVISGDCQTLPEDLDEIVPEAFSDYDEVFEYAEKSRDRVMTVEGELKRSGDIQYLQDTLASRIDLKTENGAAQSALIRFAEPLSCLTVPGDLSEKGLCRLAWRYLVENHTHDGITGCHCDETWREIMGRFKKCESLSRRLAFFGMEKLAEKLDTRFAGETALCVFHPRAGEGDVFAPFTIRVPEEKAGAYIRLFDDRGREAPVTVTCGRRVGDITSDSYAQQKFSQAVEYRGYGYFERLPGMGIKAYRVETADEKPVYDRVRAGENWAENQHIRVVFGEKGLDMTDKATGKTYSGLCSLLDRGNKGDCYHFAPDGRERELLFSWRLLDCDGALARFEGAAEYVKYTVAVNGFEGRAYVRCEMDNREKNHALCARFPMDVGGMTPFRDQAFIVEKGDMGVQPTQTFAGAERGGQGMAVFHKGLHRAEFLEGEMRLTLLQCAGRLYASFFPENENDEFGGGQMIGKTRVEFAVTPIQGGEDLFALSQEYVDGLMYRVTDGHEGPLGTEKAFFRVEGAVQSAMKREEDGSRILTRIYNPRREAVTARICLPEGAKRPVKMRLDETEEAAFDGKTLELRPGEIATVGFEWGGIG